jgi:ATP/maltotriose-dependent transcriptional regulator MalT
MKTPSQPTHVVDRPALRRMLDAVVDHRIALIVAPAGRGSQSFAPSGPERILTCDPGLT